MSKGASAESSERKHEDSEPAAAVIPARILYATYAVGLASNALVLMLKVLVPLWAVELGMSAGEIGLAIGAAGVLPFLLAIHGGSLMDRLGTRRVTLAFAMTSTVLCTLYPFLPFVAALFLLQLFSGLTTNMGWVGAQSLIVQFGRGNTTLISRFSLASRMGTLMAPIVVGAVWDISGHWGAFLFCAAWSGTVLIALLMVPKKLVESAAEKADQRVTLRDLLPRVSDYTQAFAMMAIPAVAFIVAVTYLRIGSSAMQGSFYVVYLENIGFTGTVIGILIAMSEGGGMFGTVFAGPMERIMAPHWVLLLHIVLSLFFIAVTPFLGGIFILLLIASAFRGSAQGLSQPVMFAILSRAVSRREQGMSIGLRTTANRLASMMVPPIMGFFVEVTSIEMSFVIVGGLLIALCGVVSLVIRRIPGFKT
jgi:MFS family permease